MDHTAGGASGGLLLWALASVSNNNKLLAFRMGRCVFRFFFVCVDENESFWKDPRNNVNFVLFQGAKALMCVLVGGKKCVYVFFGSRVVCTSGARDLAVPPPPPQRERE